VTERRLIDGLPDGETLGYHERGNRRVRILVGTIEVVVIVDDTAGLVVTLWVR
jgi:hypothetical protein